MKSKLIYLLSLCLALVIFSLINVGAQAEINKQNIESLAKNSFKDLVLQTHAESIYVTSLDENIEIYNKEAKKRIYPAGTVKLMTAYTAYNLIPDLDVVITASEQAIKATSGLNVKIKAGESYKAKDLFYALLVGGANDAANVLAEYCSGSIEDFVSEMNKNAKKIGADNTFYTNPTGIHDDNMYTTAFDTSLVAKEVYYINTLLEMSNTVSYELKPLNADKTVIVRSRNRLIANSYGISYYNPNAKGLSSSSTTQGGNCLVTTCAKSGLSYLIVIMNAPEIPNEDPQTVDKEKNAITSYYDADCLIDLCMNSFSKQVLLNKSKPIFELDVRNSATYDHLILYPENEAELFLPVDIDLSKVSLTHEISSDYALAPVKKGDDFGTVSVMYDGFCLYTTKLISDVEIERSGVLYVLYLIECFIKSKFFITIAVIAFILLLLYFIVAVYLNIQIKNGKYRRKKRK